MKFDFEKFKNWLLDNEKVTTEQMEETIELVNEFIENASLKNYAIFRNGTQQGTVRAKSLREAKNKVFASYGKELQVYLEEDDE